MATSIGKLSKSFFLKLLVGIIILPFVFWGMGDVFRTGNQNVVATIDSEKISSQEFLTYLNRLNLSEEERKNLNTTDLLDKILSDYIGKKIINLEMEKLGVKITDKSLSNIIMNDDTFFEENKFSRTKYEKFLLQSGLSAPAFEQNISQQEKKRQLLTFLSEGTNLPDFLIENAFQEENQIKTVQYLELDKYYKKIPIKEKEIKDIYESNKKFFTEEFKKITYVELTPSILTGQNEYSELYFKKIDEIENSILDGKKINDFAKDFNLVLIKTEEINKSKKNKSGKTDLKIDEELFSKFFNNKDLNVPELINIKNKYYLSQITSLNKISRALNNEDVKKAITSQIKIQNIIKNNSKIIKEISEGKFNKNKMKNYANDKDLEIKKTVIKNVKDNSIFSEEIIKKIFKLKNEEIDLITNSLLNKNLIIFIESTKKTSLSKSKKDYDLYKTKAKLKLTNNIFKTYDKNINFKYKVEVNQKALSRIKNTL
jgi:peptidyl-prolyl cis-trans isomerase D